MRHEKDEYYFEDEADEDRLRQEILKSLRWAIRSLELGGTVDDTMTGMIFRLETGEEWSKSPLSKQDQVWTVAIPAVCYLQNLCQSIR